MSIIRAKRKNIHLNLRFFIFNLKKSSLFKIFFVINVCKWFQNMLAQLVCFNPSLYEMLEWPSQLVGYLLHSKFCLLLLSR